MRVSQQTCAIDIYCRLKSGLESHRAPKTSWGGGAVGVGDSQQDSQLCSGKAGAPGVTVLHSTVLDPQKRARLIAHHQGSALGTVGKKMACPQKKLSRQRTQRTRQNQNLLPTYRQNLVLPGSAGARRRRAPAEPNVA